MKRRDNWKLPAFIFAQWLPAFFMTGAAVLTLSLTWSLPAAAKDPGDEASMIRMLACEGQDAKMELYLPQSMVFGKTPLAEALARSTIGYYALDLSDANKGKSLEPVKVSIVAGGKTVIVNQYTRGLPPTRIPVNGGTVDFDQRFGTQAKCGPFQFQQTF
jgi:hypothetical protein